MKKIETFMIKNHNKLSKLLISLEENPSKKRISILKINLKKHFRIEEKFIFKAFITANEIYDIFKLMEEHKEMIKLTNQINENIQNNPLKKIKELKKINSNHIKYEEKFLYPKLENILENKYKKKLLIEIKKEK